MQSLPQRLLDHFRRHELLSAGERVGVAVSGGIDSVALLRLMIDLRHELGIVLSVVHFNHKLRGADSDADQEFVAALAREHGLEFLVDSGDAAAVAAEEHSGLEAAARELRYGFFHKLLAEDPRESVNRGEGEPRGLMPDAPISIDGTAKAVPFPNFPNADAGTIRSALDKILTGHTLDDQAETVLMRLIRGTGLRGLAGIHPHIMVERDDETHAEIVRPLLGIRHRELEQYLRDLNQPWCEDASNSDERFTRNRVRRVLLPLIEKEFNRTIAENFAELAEIARDEQDYWDNEISGWLGTVVQWSQPEQPATSSNAFVQIQPLSNQQSGSDENAPTTTASLSRPWLLTEPKAVQRRVIKAIGDEAGISLEFKHVEEILEFAHEAASGKELSLPRGWRIARDQESIVFRAPDLRAELTPKNYEYQLRVPGITSVCELGSTIEAFHLTSESRSAEYNPQQLLRADKLEENLTVRNWRPGDRFWPAHTGAEKKVKELLQAKHLDHATRKLWPVVVSGKRIVWMRGFPVPAALRAGTGDAAVLIREVFDEEENEI